MNPTNHIQSSIEKEAGTQFLPALSLGDLETTLADYINQLILTDFSKLIFLLYRIDVNENTIKHLLQNTGNTAAGITIAKAIINRELEKIDLRKKYTPPYDHYTEEELF